jgi:hypothetical protein
MRRAIAATITGGLLLGGAVATPSAAAARGEGKSAGVKTVVYQGYEFKVPASWPVYRLDEHPQTCVRYDVHAVYLGKPGPDMRCPAGLVGRTQTVSVIPGRGVTAGSASSPAAHQEADVTELQQLPAIHGAVMQNAVRHQMEVTLGAATPGATVLGTYGTDPAVVEQVLSTLHQAPKGTAPTAQSAPAQPGGTAAAEQRAMLSSGRTPPATPAPAAPAKAAAKTAPVKGFDTCTAPSTTTMRAWRSSYAAVAVYIGGANAACTGGNLTSDWVRTTTGMGWGLLPTYVGPQAPCWGPQGVLIKPASAAAEGRAAGVDAVSDAKGVGLGTGSPIYYDMEGYNGGTSCKNAVLNFLGAWESQVRAAGYVPGVYSSQNSGIVDLQAATASHMPGFTPPTAIWIALWDNVATLSDGTLAWPLTARNKQYAGNVNVKVGGITLNIDRDLVGGPVLRSPAALPTAIETSSREPLWTHKLTTWPYAATVLTPSST